MKKKNLILKPVALIFVVVAIMSTFASCEYKPEPPEESAFSLVMDFAQTTVKVGEKVTYKAILKNAEHESYTLEHPSELIHLYVVNAEDYIDADIPLITDTVLAESDIAAHGQVEEFLDFQPTEAGEYVLKAYTAFSIDGKDYDQDYSYECEEILITVVE